MRPSRPFFLASALAAAACGSVPNEPMDAPPAGHDAGPDGGADAGDAMPPPPPPRCDLSKPFGAPVLVSGTTLNTATYDGNAQLTENELTIFFTSIRAGSQGADIYFATRTSTDDAFGAPQLVEGINTAGGEIAPSVSGDGRTIYFIRDAELYVADRTSATGPFTNVAPVAVANTLRPVSDPYLTASGVYFATADSMANVDIARSLRRPTGDLGQPALVGEVNLPTKGEARPVLSRDEKTIYWTSDRSDGGAVGSFDIWEAHRTSATGTFASPTNLRGLNSDKIDNPSWISADGCILYMDSDRANGVGERDLYVATRPAP